MFVHSPNTTYQTLLVSLDGQDTRFSPWRPGIDSRTRNISFFFRITHTHINLYNHMFSYINFQQKNTCLFVYHMHTYHFFMRVISQSTYFSFLCAVYIIHTHTKKIRAPRIELGTYCVLSSRHNQLDQARICLHNKYIYIS